MEFGMMREFAPSVVRFPKSSLGSFGFRCGARTMCT